MSVWNKVVSRIAKMPTKRIELGAVSSLNQLNSVAAFVCQLICSNRRLVAGNFGYRGYMKMNIVTSYLVSLPAAAAGGNWNDRRQHCGRDMKRSSFTSSEVMRRPNNRHLLRSIPVIVFMPCNHRLSGCVVRIKVGAAIELHYARYADSDTVAACAVAVQAIRVLREMKHD